MDMQILLLTLLAAIAVAALGYGIFYTSISNEKKVDGRLKALKVDKQTKAIVQTKKMDEKQRRKQREDALKNVDAQRASGKKAANPNLAAKMVQAGMTISMKKFYVLSVLFGIFVFFVALVFTGLPMLVCLGIGFVAGFGVPRWVVSFKRARRFKQFILIFPNAIDIIVRGIKSGLPLNDCLRIIANDSEEPVKSEFRKLSKLLKWASPYRKHVNVFTKAFRLPKQTFLQS
jgi:tight adherence protein B